MTRSNSSAAPAGRSRRPPSASSSAARGRGLRRAASERSVCVRGALMARALPQLGGDFFLTDGGIETTLIFLERLELPHFAAFDLFKDAHGEAALRRYFQTYARLAERYNTGLVLESATWRASQAWGEKLGYGAKEMAAVNRRAIQLLERVKSEYGGDRSKVVISGCVGPRGDGYNPSAIMSAQEAQHYHANQIRVFEDSAADMVSAIT